MALTDLPDLLGAAEQPGETSNMTGVGDQTSSLSQTLSQDMPAMMTQSMCIPSGTPMTAAPDAMTSSTSSLQGGRKSSGLRSRAESAVREREREERVRKIRENQEDERKRKLEELKAHAQSAQKFRELQETERRKHIDELRSKDMDRRMQVEERRRDIERSEQGRREAIIARNRDRESRLEATRRSSQGKIEFAFGSSAPRLVEPRVDSASGYWGSRRATSSNNVGSSSGTPGAHDRRSAERDPADLRAKRTASAQGLDRSNEGEEQGLAGGTPSSAHRRRTDLVPTLTMRREDGGPGGATPRRSPGLSRENSSSSRPGSALSASAHRTPTGSTVVGGVRLRPGSAGGRRQRPLSIATTGMTASMYEERQRPQLGPRPGKGPAAGTPKPDRMKRARSVTSDAGNGIDDDNRSTASSQSVGPSARGTPGRRTPSQVKAEAAARKAKAPARAAPSTPKSSLGRREGGGERREQGGSQGPSPAGSQELQQGRQTTPDILKDNTKQRAAEPREEERAEAEAVVVGMDEVPAVVVVAVTGPEVEAGEETSNEEVKERKIITSGEEAKARIAEKRREMKEQKEREAEVERLRAEEEQRAEEDRQRREEEEMRQLELLAEEGRRAEEERIQKAIQEKEEEERRVREEEERLKKEKEETEKKSKEEAEKREAELQEKLKKEEEERLARKKRIEEIMARTRGKAAAPAAPAAEPAAAEPQQPASLDPLGDPTRPDLLGDISDKVEAENARNLAMPAEPEVEKGALDSLSLKSEDTENSSPLITLENGVPSKKSNGVVEGGTFDQILDLGDIGDSNKEERSQGMPSPIRAFEESNTQQGHSTGALGVRDLLS